jgi:glycerol-3-phosphate responsive antiterminator
MSDYQLVCSLIKTQEQVVYDYTKNKCSLIFTVFVVKNKVRCKKISTAVFKYDRDNKWYPHHIEVYPGYKRTGVATVMYDIVQSEIDGVLVPSDEQSDAAREFWRNRLLTTPLNKYIL